MLPDDDYIGVEGRQGVDDPLSAYIAAPLQYVPAHDTHSVNLGQASDVATLLRQSGCAAVEIADTRDP